jgi:hypothetical protein
MPSKYGLTAPAAGGHQPRRFGHSLKVIRPELNYRLPLQTPIESATLTIRLRSLDDRARVLHALAGNPLSW